MADDLFEDYAKEKYGRVGDSYPADKIDRAARAARRDYEDLLRSGDLDTVTDEEAAFLAKMYVVAEHFGVLEKFKELIERGMRLRPDKVRRAAKIFDSLSLVYHDLGLYAGKHRDHLEREGYLIGKAADSYYAEFDTLLSHLYNRDKSLDQLSENTGDLLAKFAQALVDWRGELAGAIRVMAEYDRNTAYAASKGFVLGLVTQDPFEAARETLENLLYLWERSDEKGRSSDVILKKFAEERGFKLDDPAHDDVSYHGVVLPHPWDGSFA